MYRGVVISCASCQLRVTRDRVVLPAGWTQTDSPRCQTCSKRSGIESRQLVAYLAGPYRAPTEWLLERHIQRSRDAAVELWQRGYAVIAPHMNSARLGGAAPDDVWLRGYLSILERCDVVMVLPGWEASQGTRAEIAYAEVLGIPVEYL